MKEFFRDLLAKGIQIIPVRKDKTPMMTGWTKGTFSFEEVTSYKTEWYGIRTGDYNLEVLDVDLKYAENPEQLWESYKSRLRGLGFPMEKIALQKTINDGWHLIYRAPNVKPNSKLSRNAKGKVIFETRGVGGYAFIYDENVLPKIMELPMLTEEEVGILWGLAYSFDQFKEDKASFASYNSDHDILEMIEGIGFTVTQQTTTEARVLRPGETSNKSSGLVNLDMNTAYIFSPNSVLPSEKLLTPAAITCHLQYHGDWSAFGRSLNSAKMSFQSTITSPVPLFKVQTMSQVIDETRDVLPPRKLFGSFWFEHELCILFANSNAGKTAISYQIAFALAEGRSIDTTYFQNQCEPMAVVYLDFELSLQQVSARFSEEMIVSDNFKRASIPPNLTLEEYRRLKDNLFVEIERMIVQEGIKALFVDNLTALQSNTEQASEAAELMEFLNFIKGKHGISILVLAHTPKIPNHTIIEKRHLQGSFVISSLADSMFALGQPSEGSDIRYLKQLKVRAEEYTYTENNVLQIDLFKGAYGLQFRALTVSEEYPLVTGMEYRGKEERNTAIYQCHQEGMSFGEIAKKFGMSKSTIHGIVQKYFDSDGDDDQPMMIPF